jgi:hypothetical protein
MYELLANRKASVVHDPYGSADAIPHINAGFASTQSTTYSILLGQISREFICTPHIAGQRLVYECYSKYTTNAARIIFFVNCEGYVQTGSGRVYSTVNAAAAYIMYGTNADPKRCSCLGVKLKQSCLYIDDSAHVCYCFTYHQTRAACLKSPYFDDVLILYFGRYCTAFSVNNVDFEEVLRRACIGAQSIPKALGEYKPSHQICSTNFWLTPKWLEDSIISSDYKNRQLKYQF